MKRKEVSSYAFQGMVITPGLQADSLLDIMPRVIMTRDPKVIGRDEDGLIVEWYYSGVVFTLARASGINPVTGLGAIAYFVQRIEEWELNHDKEDIANNN